MTTLFRLNGVLAIILGAAIPFCAGTAQTSDAPRSAAALIDRVRKYQQAHDTADIEALVYWGKATDRSRMVVRSVIAAMLSEQIIDIRLVRLAPGDTLTYRQDGVRYIPTLPPVGKLEIELKPRPDKHLTQQSLSFMVGAREGRFYLVVAEPEHALPPDSALGDVASHLVGGNRRNSAQPTRTETSINAQPTAKKEKTATKGT